METKKRALGRGLEQLFNNENLDFFKFSIDELDEKKGNNNKNIITIDKITLDIVILLAKFIFI